MQIDHVFDGVAQATLVRWNEGPKKMCTKRKGNGRNRMEVDGDGVGWIRR